MRLAALTSHPIQYYAPLLRELARHVDLQVFFANRTTPQQQATAGFGTEFEWDVDLTSGYAHEFLENVSSTPGTGHFSGCDTPQIAVRLREGRFDAVMVFGWYLKSCIQAIVAAKRLGLPVLVRGDSQLATPRSRLKRLAKDSLYPLLLRVFDGALYPGRSSRAYYEHYHYPPARLFFSPHCVDTEWFRARATEEARHALRERLGIAPEAKVVMFAGKLLPFKRPLDVVETCARLNGEGLAAQLLVAGSGELEAEIRACAAALGVTAHLIGFQNQTQMPAAYAAADVLMLPSDGRETWGLVCNEALACGRPIVVSDAIGCGPDLAADERAGRIYPLGDVDSAAKAVAALALTPPSSEAIRLVSDQYGLETAVAGIVEAVTTLTANRSRGGRAAAGSGD